jgi:hypothetical protein
MPSTRRLMIPDAQPRHCTCPPQPSGNDPQVVLAAWHSTSAVSGLQAH